VLSSPASPNHSSGAALSGRTRLRVVGAGVSPAQAVNIVHADDFERDDTSTTRTRNAVITFSFLRFSVLTVIVNTQLPGCPVYDLFVPSSSPSCWVSDLNHFTTIMPPGMPVWGRHPLLVLLCIFSGIAFAIEYSVPVRALASDQHLFSPQQVVLHAPEQKQLLATPEPGIFPGFLHALDVLQQEFFATWQGVWPTSIDWTAAVLGTHLAASLATLSTSYSSLDSDKDNENIINKYFSHLISAYFGQDVFGLMQQANDDMLWVVLEWLESIKFIELHSALHYTEPSSTSKGSWHGTQYIPAFAHRARIFWDLASKGWDTALCNGGMVWSPLPPPYKNAITNELYITASISMYLYFPGDDNASPFDYHTPGLAEGEPPGKPHDPKYLGVAIEAYNWLKHSHMINSQGLYTDGFHISGWTGTNNTGTVCDLRDEMVYTYNQGVLLSGLRGMYEGTGARDYLEDAHKLVRDVIRATGWRSWPFTNSEVEEDKPLGRWHGLGRSGILEDACDASGRCSQDGQNFKGIFFHHLALFCAPLPRLLKLPQGYSPANELDRAWHDVACARYTAWIQHNAKAALTSKDEDGKFGMWWGAPKNAHVDAFPAEVMLPDGAVDHRNPDVNSPDTNSKGSRVDHAKDKNLRSKGDHLGKLDLNDRGRGRTVETHGGGVAVLRSAWESLLDENTAR
jgi:hypothetical protein